MEGYICSERGCEGDAQRGGAAAERFPLTLSVCPDVKVSSCSSREVHLFDDMVQTWYEIGWYSFCTSDLFVLFTTGTGRVSTVEKKKWKRRDLR